MWLEILEQVLMNRQFGERFREILNRAKGDRSQSELAKLLGVSSSAVQKWLSGNGFPSSDNLEKIAKAAGLSGVDALRNYLKGEEGVAQGDAPLSAEEAFISVRGLSKEERKRLIKLLVDLD
ncbi:helix-turn-helix domain-containing protein [Nostoc sp. CHAB 5844]|nr:helix-turn-helix domain-containing protein [Nostoc sp. CHAB 5844]